MIKRFKEDEMLSAQEVAERLNMSSKSIHYYRKKGLLDAYRVKFNRYVFRGEDLNRLIDREKEKAALALKWAMEDSVSKKGNCQNEIDSD